PEDRFERIEKMASALREAVAASLPIDARDTTSLAPVDTIIDSFPPLPTMPIPYHSLLLSYSRQDHVFVKRLYKDLQAQNMHCWFAPHDLQPGTRIFKGVDEAIHLHDKLLLILSRHALASSWVELEVDSALQKEKKSGQRVLFPLRLDNSVLESDAGWARML